MPPSTSYGTACRRPFRALISPSSQRGERVDYDQRRAAVGNGQRGAFSSTFTTSALGVAGSPYTITYSYAGDTNLSAASNASETLTVTPAAPVFSSLSAPSVAYGTATTILSGMISLVPNGENVSITVNGVKQAATVSGGAFSSSFNTSALGVAGSPYTITYSYTGDANLTRRAIRARP